MVIRFSATPREGDPNAAADRFAAIPISVADRFVVVDQSEEADPIYVVPTLVPIWVLSAAPIWVDSAVQTVVPTEVRSAVVPNAADPSGVKVRTR